MASVIILRYETDVSTGEAVCVLYVRWDWETTLARLRPLLSITGVAGEPVLPELCLRVRTRPGQHGREMREAALRYKTHSCVLPPQP